MRDPNRLASVYETMRKFHAELVPDLRVGQLLLNFFSWHLQKYGSDGFYIEDDKFIARFAVFIDEMTDK